MLKGIRVIFLLLVTLPGLGQIPSAPVSVTSPNAASLGQYGDIPVSQFTGLPNISVPLYTLQSGKLSVPIGLSYRASGFRPEEHPGWVGSGWDLESGGVITRRVNDAPDDYDNMSQSPGHDIGFYSLNRRRGLYYDPLSGASVDWSTENIMQAISYAFYRYDTEPDEFSFNFQGYSGKFYMGLDGWRVKCNKPIRVTENALLSIPTFSNSTIPTLHYPTFGGFTITIEDGTQYVFGNNTDAIEYSTNFFDQNHPDWIANAWYLTKIKRDGQEINFTYAREYQRFISQLYFSASAILSQQSYIRVGSSWNLGPHTTMSCSSTSGITPLNAIQGQLVAPTYLSSIADGTTTIRFPTSNSQELRYAQTVYDGNNPGGPAPFPILEGGTSLGYPRMLDLLQWKQLDSIKIQSQNKTVKSFLLRYNNSSTQRLTLSSVQEIGQNGLKKPAYRFDYYPLSFNIPYEFDNVDAWGFYNQRSSKYYLAQQPIYDQQRTSNPDSSVYLLGTLKAIHYPTGGMTEFIYEQHKFAKQVQIRSQGPTALPSDQSAGGLRIKKIRNYLVDGGPATEQKKYFYISNYRSGMTPSDFLTARSSGVSTGQSQYTFSDYRLPVYGGDDGYLSSTIFSSQSVIPACSNNHGSHVGYTEVVEARSDGSFTRYLFSNFDTAANYDEAPAYLKPDASYTAPIPYQPYSSTAEERGQLLSKTLYKPSIPTDIPVSRLEIAYTPFDKNTDYIRAMKATSTAICGQAAMRVLEASAYKVYTYSSLPVQETSTVYDLIGGNPSVTVKTYSYKTYNGRTVGLVSVESTTDSKGQSLSKSYQYPFNYPSSTAATADPVARAMGMMTSQNMIGYPIETLVQRNGQVIGASAQTYSYFGSSSATIQPFQTFELELNRPLSLTQITRPSLTTQGSGMGFNPGDFKLKFTFTDYDSKDKGNALSFHKEGHAPTTYVWDYNTTLPVAVTQKAMPSQVAYTGFEADGPSFVSNTFQSTGPYGWDYDPRLNLLSTSGSPIGLQRNGGVTGKGFYILNGNWSVSRASLPPGDYELAFWAQGGAGNIFAWTLNGSQITGPTDLRTNPQGYHLLRYRIHVNQGITESVAFDAYGRFVGVDDVRLYPVGAQMITYTHDPVAGVTSISDANSQPTTYEYDGLKRLKLVKDAQGKITKHLEYHYQE